MNVDEIKGKGFLVKCYFIKLVPPRLITSLASTYLIVAVHFSLFCLSVFSSAEVDVHLVINQIVRAPSCVSVRPEGPDVPVRGRLPPLQIAAGFQVRSRDHRSEQASSANRVHIRVRISKQGHNGRDNISNKNVTGSFRIHINHKYVSKKQSS